MAEVINGAGSGILGAYNLLISSLGPVAGSFVNLFVIVLLIVLYSIFVWKLHKIISKKNLLDLNLNKYNLAEYGNTKLVSAALYFLEYIIILPFFTFFWFMAFAVFIIIFTENLDINLVFIISAAIITSIRMTAYYNESLSREMAKLLPFNLLAASLIVGQNFFSVERIIGHLVEIPSAMNIILPYLAFIMLIEIILRFFDFTFSLFDLEYEDEEKETEIPDD
jgi:hypothetical protein